MYKRSFHKICSLLAVVMAILLIAGCSPTNSPDDDRKVYPEFLTITVFDSLANYEGIQSGWFAKIVKERFNIELSIIAPNVSSDGDASFRDRFAAGNIGDLIICGNSGGQLQEMVDAGLVLDMSSYLVNSKLLSKYGAAISNLGDSIRSKNHTAIYAIPTSISTAGAMTPSEGDTPSYGVYIRYDLYEQLGSPKVETLEDLLPLLEQMKALSPTSDSGQPSYAFSLFSDWDENMCTFAKQPCCFYGYDELGFVLLDAAGNDIQNVVDRDGLYLRSLRFYFRANQMNLVDPESTLNHYSDVFSKTQDGQILFAPWPWLGQSAYNTEEHMSQGKAMMFIPIEDEKIICNGSNECGSSEVVVCIGSQAKDPGRIADFIDWLYSPEGISTACAARNQATAGPMGLTWEMTDAGPALTEFGQKALTQDGDAKLPAEWGDGTWAEGVCQLNFNPVAEIEKDENGYAYYYDQWESYKLLAKSDIEVRWMQHYDTSDTMSYIQKHNQIAIAPATKGTREAETAELGTIRKQCGKIITSYSWKMVFADSEDEFESLYEEMIRKLDAYGYDQIYEFDYNYAKTKCEERHQVAASAGR